MGHLRRGTSRYPDRAALTTLQTGTNPLKRGHSRPSGPTTTCTDRFAPDSPTDRGDPIPDIRGHAACPVCEYVPGSAGWWSPYGVHGFPSGPEPRGLPYWTGPRPSPGGSGLGRPQAFDCRRAARGRHPAASPPGTVGSHRSDRPRRRRNRRCRTDLRDTLWRWQARQGRDHQRLGVLALGGRPQAADIRAVYRGEKPEQTKSSRSFDWSRLHAILEALPEGQWTTYEDLADGVGTAPQPLGAHITNCARR